MAALLPSSQIAVPLAEGGHILLTVVNYTAASDTVDVDGSAAGVAYFMSLESGGTNPATTAVVGVAGANSNPGYSRVTIGANTTGTIGRVLVITRHPGTSTSFGTGIGN